MTNTIKSDTLSELISSRIFERLEFSNIVNIEPAESDDSFETYSGSIGFSDADAIEVDHMCDCIRRGFANALDIAILREVNFNDENKITKASIPWKDNQASIVKDLESTGTISPSTIVYFPLKLWSIRCPFKTETDSAMMWFGNILLNEIEKALVFPDKFLNIKISIVTKQGNPTENETQFITTLKYKIEHLNDNYKIIEGI